ncbi:OmpH family outer membrane protein [Flavobacterium sp.]|uniref:OmpH family outer membrane protein n=1 Tax=Flavobacterium sp. TaxID=239 RepID=UPI002606E74E|nr:OmpH family outer membrane protein [Flavobacterium sp.]
MKKILLVLFTALAALTATAQRGLKIAYIDMEYILDKVPDYAEAKNQLEQRAQKWKQDIETKRNEINKLKESLATEKALLTKELIEEREEEIAFQEKELLDYQMKRFGPTGDLMTQKSVLVKPIQDQVFNIIQDLAEARNYDFVFDKSSDLTMLFSAKRHDISDLVVRRLTRTARQEQLSNKELKKLEEQDAQEDLEADPAYQERQKKLEERQELREKAQQEREAAREAKRKEYEERRQRMIDERDAKRNARNGGTTETPATNTTGTEDDTTPTNENRPAATPTPKSNTAQPVPGENGKSVKTTATETPEEGTTEEVNKQNTAQDARAERQRVLDEQRKAAAEKRQKAIEERQAARKAREEEKNKKTNEAAPATDSPDSTDDEE